MYEDSYFFKKERKEKKIIDIPPAEKYFCKWELGQDIFIVSPH